VAIAYREIGVVTAHSSNPNFEAAVEADRRVLGATLSPVIESGQGSAAFEADPDDDPDRDGDDDRRDGDGRRSGGRRGDD
jgi:hypothetical protein